MEKAVDQVKTPFWNVKQCAAYAGCSTGAIWLWVRAGLLPTYGLGRVVRFKQADIELLMSQRGLRNKKASKRAARG